MSKLIQSCGFLRGMLSNLGNIGKKLGKKAITDLAIPLSRDNLPGLVNNLASNTTSYVIHKLGRKISGKGAAGTGRRFNLFFQMKI